VVLLAGLMRSAAVTGRPESLFTHVTARQGGRWAEQAAGAALAPAEPARPARDPAQMLRDLSDLHDRGLLTDAELERLRRELQL